MIKEFTRGSVLFTIEEVSTITDMPKSLVEYIEKNKSNLAGVDLLYTPRITYPYCDITTPTGRRRFRPANITVSSFTYDHSQGVKTSTSILVYEDVLEEVRVYEAVYCIRRIDMRGNICHSAEMPVSLTSWWESLPDDTTVGYEWTGVYFYEVFKYDISNVTFLSLPIKYKPWESLE